MKLRNIGNIGALVLGMLGAYTTSNSNLSAQTSDSIPPPSDSYVGEPVSRYTNIDLDIGEIDNPLTPTVSLNLPIPLASGDTAYFRESIVYHNETSEGRERRTAILREEFPDFPRMRQEQFQQFASKLGEMFSNGDIDYILHYPICPIMFPVPEEWYYPGGGTFMFRRTPFRIIKSENIRNSNEPKSVIDPYGTGTIYVQLDRLDGNPGSYELSCPSG